MSKFKLLIFFICGCALLGCSRGVMIYKFADSLIAYEVDDYFDLTSAQSKELKANLTQDMVRSKETILVEASDFFSKTLTEVDQKEMTPAFVLQKSLQFQALMKKAAAHFKDTSVKMVAELKPEQLKELKNKIDEENESSRKKNKDDQLALITALERYEKFFKLWFLDMSAEQEKLLENFLKENPRLWELQVKNREHMYENFAKAFPDIERRKAYVAGLSENYQSGYLPEYLAAMETHRKAVATFFAEKYWPTVSERQRNNLKKELNSRISQIKEIRESK